MTIVNEMKAELISNTIELDAVITVYPELVAVIESNVKDVHSIMHTVEGLGYKIVKKYFNDIVIVPEPWKEADLQANIEIIEEIRRVNSSSMPMNLQLLAGGNNTLDLSELTSLINAKIDSVIKEEEEIIKEAKSTMDTWVNVALIENPEATTKDVVKLVNAKFLDSYTFVKTDESKCIEDCSKCKYKNHKTATSRTCKKYGNLSIRKAVIEKGGNIEKTVQAHMYNGIKELNDQVLSGDFMEKITTQSNDKLEGIPTLNMPNIFTQVQFMEMVDNNKDLLDLPVVALVYAYFKKYAMCKNCQYCNGLCYNNKFLIKNKDKALSEIRNLIAYILRRDELQEKINSEMGNSRLFRIHGNGEFHSMENLEFWLEICKNNPDVKFYTYTKSYEIFEQYLSSGEKLPKNFILNVSMVEGQQSELENKYPLLMENNKFIIILKKELVTDKKATVCGGKCLKCTKGCHAKLRSQSRIIYVPIH